MRALSGADVLVEDKLFATLDPVTRRIALPQVGAFLLTDTVGFIQKLPTQLVAAFRATLEELSEASLLLHVVDITHPDAAEQAQTVEDTLADLGLADKPCITVFNKADLICGPDGLPIEGLESVPEARASLKYWRPDALLVSAVKGWGLTELLVRIEAALGRGEESEAASWGYRVQPAG
jgi:GTP-binding protein HflX